MGFEFDSIEDAEKFYNTYSSAMGFSVRKDDIRHYKNGTISIRRWVCSKEGLRSKKDLEKENRKKEPKALTRSNCLAALRVNYNKLTGKYIVKEFTVEHSHRLAALREV